MAKLIIRTDGRTAEVIELKKGLNRLGRSARNDFQLDHDSISRFHAEVVLTDEWLCVRDMDSSNGVFVNDEQVQESPLETGQILRLGEVDMLVKDAPVLKERKFAPCEDHPETKATMVCKQCRRKYCNACVHILRRSGGKILRLCPKCSGHCVPLSSIKDEPTGLTNFVRRLLKKTTTKVYYEP
jgi:hypothetical protein